MIRRKAKLIVCNEEGKFLLLRKKGLFPKYSLIGGNIKKNESPEKAVIREAKEEGDLNISKGQLKFVLAKLKIDKREEEATYYYRINKVNHYRLNEPHKFISLDWIDRSEAEKYLNAKDFKILKKYIIKK